MRKLSLQVLAALAVLVFLTAAVSAAPREAAVERGLMNDDPYARHLIESAGGVKGSEARELMQQVRDSAPDTPGFYFALARVSLPSMVDSFGYFMEGFKAYGRSFWWQVSFAVLLSVSLLVSASIALTLTAIIRFFRDLPLLAHDINERKALLLVPLIALGYMVLGPLCIAGGLLFIICLYKKRSSKALVYIALLLVMLSPLWTRALDRALSLTNVKARAIVAVNEGRDNSLALQSLAGEKDFESRFSYALAVKRETGALEATVLLEELIKENPDPRLYTNLGNAYVVMERMDLAKTSYLKAVSSGGSVTTLFNLAQIYRHELDYENGDKYYNEAQALDQAKISEFAARMGGRNKLLVMDEVLTAKEVAKVVLKSPVTNSVMPFPYGAEIPAGYALFLFVLFLALSGKLGGRAYVCKDCGDVACQDCSGDTKLCMECISKLSDEGDVSPQARIKRMLQASKRKEKLMAVIRGLSFTPPGIAQAYTGRVFSAFMYMWIISFSVTVVLLNPFMGTGLSGGSHGWITLVVTPLVLITYYVSIVTVNRRLDRGWL